MDHEMPADPFREGQFDWGPMASNNYAFFSSHVAAGFSEAQALEMTGRYLTLVLTIMANSAPPQQQEPGQGQAGGA